MHKNSVYGGLHEPIIDFEIFEKTQQLLAQNALIRKNSTNAASGSLLKGKLFDDKDNYMSPTHSNKQGKRYRYYVSQAQIQNRLQDIGSVSKISAGEIENFVTEKVKEFVFNKKLLQELFANYSVSQQKIIFEQIESKQINADFIRHMLIKAKISSQSVLITVSKTLTKEAVEYMIFGTHLPVEQKYDKNSLVELDYNIRISSTTKNGSKMIIGDIHQKEINKSLVEAIVKSFYYHKLMFENKLTPEQKVSTYVHRIMKLRFLPKEIIKAVLTGSHEPDWTIDKLYTFI